MGGGNATNWAPKIDEKARGICAMKTLGTLFN